MRTEHWTVVALLTCTAFASNGVGSNAVAPPPSAGPLDHGGRERALNAFASLPLAFVENRGQTDARVRYYAQGSRYAFHLTRREVVLSFVKGSGASSQALGSRIHLLASEAGAEEPASRGVALALRFLRANPRVIVEGEKQAPGEVNYFRGKDP